MLNKQIPQSIKRLVEMLHQLFDVAIDVVFMLVWASLHWALEHAKDQFKLGDFDNVMLLIFQIIFAVVTIYPLVCKLYENMLVVTLNTRKNAKEIRLNFNTNSTGVEKCDLSECPLKTPKATTQASE
jgi:hypothetical protein